jgi:hypothetical protein
MTENIANYNKVKKAAFSLNVGLWRERSFQTNLCQSIVNDLSKVFANFKSSQKTFDLSQASSPGELYHFTSCLNGGAGLDRHYYVNRWFMFTDRQLFSDI